MWTGGRTFAINKISHGFFTHAHACRASISSYYRRIQPYPALLFPPNLDNPVRTPLITTNSPRKLLPVLHSLDSLRLPKPWCRDGGVRASGQSVKVQARNWLC
eukprot:IDg9024t1